MRSRCCRACRCLTLRRASLTRLMGYRLRHTRRVTSSTANVVRTSAGVVQDRRSAGVARWLHPWASLPLGDYRDGGRVRPRTLPLDSVSRPTAPRLPSEQWYCSVGCRWGGVEAAHLRRATSRAKPEASAASLQANQARHSRDRGTTRIRAKRPSAERQGDVDRDRSQQPSASPSGVEACIGHRSRNNFTTRPRSTTSTKGRSQCPLSLVLVASPFLHRRTRPDESDDPPDPRPPTEEAEEKDRRRIRVTSEHGDDAR